MGVLIGSSIDSFIQLIGVLVIFVFVLLITYLTTKWMGGLQKGRVTGSNLRVIETISVGNGLLISLIETGKIYLVISIGKDGVHLLTQLSREELKDTSFLDQDNSVVATDSFQEILMKLKDKIPRA